MKRGNNGTSCRSSEDRVSLQGFQGEASPVLPSWYTSSAGLDLHYFTAYLLLGTDMFTKHLPSYAKGNISEGTFALPTSFFNTNTHPLEAAQMSPIFSRSHHSRMIFPWGNGKTPPVGLTTQSLSNTARSLLCGLAKRGGLFLLSCLWYPFNL